MWSRCFSDERIQCQCDLVTWHWFKYFFENILKQRTSCPDYLQLWQSSQMCWSTLNYTEPQYLSEVGVDYSIFCPIWFERSSVRVQYLYNCFNETLGWLKLSFWSIGCVNRWFIVDILYYVYLCCSCVHPISIMCGQCTITLSHNW